MQLTAKQFNNFWSKVEKTEDCWNWTAHTNNGYGRVNINYKVYLAHKLSMFISGYISDPLKKEIGARGVVIMHTCDNRLCIRPSHLKIATQKENMQDAKSKGRKWYGENSGENHPRAKLKWTDIQEIRLLIGIFSQSALAKIYGVDKSQISMIKLGKTWRTN
jgi:hypothetical protein